MRATKTWTSAPRHPGVRVRNARRKFAPKDYVYAVLSSLIFGVWALSSLMEQGSWKSGRCNPTYVFLDSFLGDSHNLLDRIQTALWICQTSGSDVVPSIGSMWPPTRYFCKSIESTGSDEGTH